MAGAPPYVVVGVAAPPPLFFFLRDAVGVTTPTIRFRVNRRVDPDQIQASPSPFGRKTELAAAVVMV